MVYSKSSKLSGICLKDRRCHLDEGHVSEKIYSLKSNRRDYVGKITEIINKCMNVGNKSSLEFETCLQKLKKYKHKIKTVSDSLIELTNDPDQLQNISDFYTEEDIEESSKLVSNYNSSPVKFLRADDEQFSKTSYYIKLKSKYVYEKLNLLCLPHSKPSSETSYLSINERSKTLEHRELLAQQIKEHTQKKIQQSYLIYYNNCLNLKSKKV